MTLREIARLGCTQLRVSCLQPRCQRTFAIGLQKLLVTVPPTTELREVARRARCRSCGNRGAHVEPCGLGERRRD